MLLLVAREVTLSTLPSLVIALSNAFGLVAITMFLGYGLVEVPRFTWRRAEPEVRLKLHLFRCPPNLLNPHPPGQGTGA